MASFSPCYVCGHVSAHILPSALIIRLVSSLQLDSQQVEDLTSLVTCVNCSDKLSKIEQLVTELQDSFRKPRINVMRDESKILEQEEGSPASPTKRRKTKPRKLIVGDEDNGGNIKSSSPHYVCSCGQKSDTMLEFTEHQKESHGAKYVCTFVGCGKTFTRPYSLKRHQYLHNPETHECQLCGEKLPTPHHLKDHTRKLHNSTQTLSAQMDSVLPPGSVVGAVDKASPENTNNNGEEDVVKELPDAAQRNSSTEDDVTSTHVTSESVDVIPDLPCPICDHSYQLETTLMRHIEKYHWRKNDESLICCQCSAVFRDVKELLPHAREHREQMQKCDVCGKVFQNWSHMVRHRASSHGSGPEMITTETQLTCETCKTIVNSESLLSYHKLLEHGQVTKLLIPRPQLTYRCDTCTLSFMKPRDLDVHTQTHVKRTHHLSHYSVYECPTCIRSFSHSATLQAHRLECSGGSESSSCEGAASLVEFPCPVCDSSYEMKPSLERHIREAHWRCEEGRLECTRCSQTYSNVKEMVEHGRSHRPELLPCRVCSDAVFTNHNQLTMHHSLCHANNKQTRDVTTWTCSQCGVEGASRSLLSLHTLSEHDRYLECKAGSDTRTYHCQHCKKTFMKLHNLKHHMRVSHCKNRESVEEHSCPNCHRVYKEDVLLQAHRTQCKPHDGRISNEMNSGVTTPPPTRRRERKEGGLCNMCGLQFKSNLFYEKHMMQHTGVWKVECAECGAKFVRESHLRAHMKRHTKPHVCTTCGARYAHSGHLREHQVIHGSKQDWKCEVCGRDFRWRLSLIRHLDAAHSIGQKYQRRRYTVRCQLCGLQLMSTSMRKHITRKHEKNYKRSYFIRLAEVTPPPPLPPPPPSGGQTGGEEQATLVSGEGEEGQVMCMDEEMGREEHVESMLVQLQWTESQ